MSKRHPTITILCAAVLAITACDRQSGDPAAGEPLPDTFPVSGSSSDLPEGMPLPPQPMDTLPR